MYNSFAENELIIPDIADVMADYTSIQLDIDERKIKAALLVAQRVDVKKIIGKANIDRVTRQEDDASDADKALLQSLIPPLCYYTYARCLLMFQGVLTDSGYIVEGENEAETLNNARSQAKQIKGVAEDLMQDVIEFLEKENPSNTDVDSSKLTPRVRVFGGKESRYNPTSDSSFRGNR